jgi:PilZ domain-containing protein
MGRDLSRGGMRVDPNPLLAVGMNVRLAVHAETREAPMILNAMVVRDDGEQGVLLRFRDLSGELARYLDYVIHALPLVIDDDDDEGCLITELLEAS